MAALDSKVESVRLDDISIVGDRRPTEPDAVGRLAASIAVLGLRTPIALRRGEGPGDFILIAGGHRLAACRSLGWVEVPAFVLDFDEVDAELWEISENLHRADLSKAQRDEQIRRYAELLERRSEKGVSPQIDAKPKNGRPTGVASKVAEQTGLSKSTVERALNPERVAEEKKKRIADAADRAEKAAEAKRRREAEQAGFDRDREAHSAKLPDFVAERESAKAEAIAARKGKAGDDTEALEARISELEEENEALKGDIDAARKENTFYADMKVEWEKGGFEEVVSGLRFQIAILHRQIETFTAERAAEKRRGDFYMRKAKEAGWSNEEVIDLSETSRA